ncbi:hypothetical protein BGX30_007091, partial [Mortierella sp. GBA39]
MYNPLTLFCLVDGEATSQAFSVDIDQTKTVDHLKKFIKNEIPDTFNGVDAKDLTLWRVSILITRDNSEIPILFNNIAKEEKEKLHPADDLSDIFDEKPPKKTIHIIVQRPSQVHAPIPARALTPLPGSLSESSRPSDLHADIKRITNKFFAPGPIVDFLDAFVKGEGALPTTSGSIRGLPRAWRRGFGKPSETRPSLLFMDLPDPSTPDSASRNRAAGSILELVQENNRYHIPVFGVSGCGKTRAVIELLSQHWGFYFNASSDDWGSGDMMTLHSTIQKHLDDTKGSFVVDRQANNAYARKITLLLFLSRLLIFKYCLGVPGCAETFSSARWTLLQVCPHVLFDDLFNVLFRALRRLVHHREGYLSDYVSDAFKDVKGRLVGRGCLPKIKDDTRLLVINDEAQFLGD